MTPVIQYLTNEPDFPITNHTYIKESVMKPIHLIFVQCALVCNSFDSVLIIIFCVIHASNQFYYDRTYDSYGIVTLK